MGCPDQPLPSQAGTGPPPPGEVAHLTARHPPAQAFLRNVSTDQEGGGEGVLGWSQVAGDISSIQSQGHPTHFSTFRGLLQSLPSWCGSHGGSRIGGGAWGAGGEDGTGGTGGHLCWVLNPQGDSSSEH